MSVMAGEDGLMLIPAPDEPAKSGRHIPLPSRRMNAAALLARRGIPGLAGGFMGRSLSKGIGGISAGPLPDLMSILGPAMTAGAGVAVGWLQGRAGRKVRLKVGDTEAEARTVDELKELMKLAREISTRPTNNDR